MNKKKWSVYILECLDGSFYTGVSNNVDARMNSHENGKGSKYVSKKGFKRLLRVRPCKGKSQACKFEYEIKQLPRREKLKWFNEN
jgi:putative endonuclease